VRNVLPSEVRNVLCQMHCLRKIFLCHFTTVFLFLDLVPLPTRI
jgi:hypothetical protein